MPLRPALHPPAPDTPHHQQHLGGPLGPPTKAVLREPTLAHRIVIVGGGAGGIDLATRLGGDLGRRGLAEVLLVDPALTHIWKPVLHAVAAGRRTSGGEGVEFLAQAQLHHFHFHLGRMDGLDRQNREVLLKPLLDDDGREIAPRRSLGYDTLVLCLGSVANEFGTPGVQDFALHLDSAADAHRLHRRLLAACARAEVQGDGPVDVVIVGGGATGVELAAELHGAVGDLAAYGLHLRQLPQPARVCLVERGSRLLAALPEPTAARALSELRARGIEVRLDSRVEAVIPRAVQLGGGIRLSADISVWCAGIQGPQVLERMDGLELGPARQLLVRQTLQTTLDDAIFALGDCAHISAGPSGSTGAAGAPAASVPATAQAAHQQARFLAAGLARRLGGEGLAARDWPVGQAFVFRERGALVSIGRTRAVGSVVGALTGRRFSLHGVLALWSYRALHLQHLLRLQGPLRALLTALGAWLARRHAPPVKLH